TRLTAWELAKDDIPVTIITDNMAGHIMKSGKVDADLLVPEALDAVGLPAARYLDRWPHELSGGERQRVALARGLVLRPRLIVADEPTAMLDSRARVGLLQLMADLRTLHGMSYLFVTHDLALADGFCDRLVVMDQGRVVEDGPSAEVVGRPVHPATVALVGAARRLQEPFTREGARR
ncbi:MAG TPA: ABC transporter ATP-binding protein, partial [Acidimicrobiales bacterium]